MTLYVRFTHTPTKRELGSVPFADLVFHWQYIFDQVIAMRNGWA